MSVQVVSRDISSQPISVDALKEHLRLTGDFEIKKVASCLASAFDYAENYTGRTFSNTVFKATLPAAANMPLPRSNVKEIKKISFINAARTEIEVPASAYWLDARGEVARIYFNPGSFEEISEEIPEPLTIEFETAVEKLRESMEAAILILGAMYFENRTAETDFENVNNLLLQHKIFY